MIPLKKSKLLIHIGPHKTGSSHLQYLLRSNAPVLGDHAITPMTPRLKDSIRKYLRECRMVGRLRIGNAPAPWFMDCPEAFFETDPSHEYGILSEEALFKLFRSKADLLEFDRFLAERYAKRSYLAVLREVNGHITSQLSQQMKGVHRFDYKDCQRALKRYSLDRWFSGILDTPLRLEIATFQRFVAGRQSAENISRFIEREFGVFSIHLKGVDGAKNKSLGAEGTAIWLAYNNVMRMLLGRKKLAQNRVKIRNSRRQLDKKVLEMFPLQNKFFPYTEVEQVQFRKQQMEKSKRFIHQFPGVWVDEVFTPVVREKSIAFVSEFAVTDRKAVVEMLVKHIHGLLKRMAPDVKPVARPRIVAAISYFLENEKKLVL